MYKSYLSSHLVQSVIIQSLCNIFKGAVYFNKILNAYYKAKKKNPDTDSAI